MRFSAQKCLVSAIFLCFLVALSMLLYLTRNDNEKTRGLGDSASDKRAYRQELFMDKVKFEGGLKGDVSDLTQDREDKLLVLQNHGVEHFTLGHGVLDRLRSKYPLPEELKEVPNYNVHAFYYTWYGNPDHDGKYYHWNHPFLPHWSVKEREKWRTGKHTPPGDIGANFYPELGAYSSGDPDIMAQHMLQLRQAGVGVISLSWYPPGAADDAGKPTDPLVPLLLDVANIYSIKINFHIEPYKTRSPASLRDNVRYILTKYGSHPAFYWHVYRGRSLPMFYIYDSYLVETKDWTELLSPGGSISVRGTDLDAIFIGLLVHKNHEADIIKAGFDGFYTYFASNGFTHGSTWNNWPQLSFLAHQKDLLFIPSVGPGYVDTEVRPWNKQNTKDRARGKYYESCFTAAIDVKPSLVTITSFNEWHEGTQIEPAIVKQRSTGGMYSDYRPYSPDYYLGLTKTYIKRFEEKIKA